MSVDGLNAECLKLTLYFNEYDRSGDDLVCNRLLALFESHGIEVSILLRGIEGFGVRHELHTQRVLSLSERGLPLVVVAVDTRTRIQTLVPAVCELVAGGLVSLERARLLRGRVSAVSLPEELHEATKLTVYCGRAERSAGRPAFARVVERLKAHHVPGAAVLLGLDGTFNGVRKRARFFSRNEDVPLMIVSVGPGEAIARALPEVTGMLARPIVTLERVRLCKRDGRRLAEPTHLPEQDDAGLPVFEKLMVYCAERARHGGGPLYLRLMEELRRSQVAGATVLRGIWGYSHEGPPDGDRWLQVRRNVPVATVMIDRPSRMRAIFPLVDAVTDETGLVTSEMVPAFQVGPSEGGMRLAGPLRP